MEVNETTRLVKPAWLKVKAPGSPEYMNTRNIVREHGLHTVCEEAACPNIGECWSHRTATFLIMGNYCTRRCRFCNVKKGTRETLLPLDPLEPENVGHAVEQLGLRHVVITSVDRDDIPDKGGAHYAATVAAVHRAAPDCKVELLIPDMQGKRDCLEIIVKSGINILNHNLETVPRLYREVRPGSIYTRSLDILRWAKEIDPDLLTKSGIMVGLTETREEVLTLMDDLRAANVDIMTIGQYLRPTSEQLPVKEFITPEAFKDYEEQGLARGFKFVESGPLVRSSYHAWKHSIQAT